MSDKVRFSKQDAAWYRKWKKRIENGNPSEGDYNFFVYRSGSDDVYVPPADESEPAIFLDGSWKLISELYEESIAQDQSESE